MKYWVLYFFAIFAGLLIMPILASNSIATEESPKITVFIGGETKEISIEEYTLRVLIANNAACENAESKKALAVSARSCATYFSVYGCKHDEFDACDDGNCCIKLGSPEDINRETFSELLSVCEETKGEILTLDSMPAIALFTRCASKGTRQCEEFPYLIPVPEATRCETHKTECEYEIENELGSLLGNTEEHPPYLVFNENEKCELAILGGNIIDGNEVATLLSLPTTEFLLTIEESTLNATCYGIGHGYGLNLCGADMLAENGMDYKNILKHYYPKLEINKIYNN